MTKKIIELLRGTKLLFRDSYKYQPVYTVDWKEDTFVKFTGETYRTNFNRDMFIEDFESFIESAEFRQVENQYNEFHGKTLIIIDLK